MSPTTAEQLASEPAQPVGPAPFVTGTGHGKTADEAYAAAARELERELTGAIGWSAVLGVEIHARGKDFTTTVSRSDGVVVKLGLSESKASALLGECQLSRPHTKVPGPWRGTIDAVVLARAAAMVCARRDALFGVACDPPDTAEATAEFEALGAGVAVTPIFPEGAPLDPNGAPMRSGGVYVFWHGTPVDGVPLRVTAVDGRPLPSISTGSSGRAELPLELADHWKGGVLVDVDFHHMVGPLDLSWKNKAVELRPRPVQTSRWALLVIGGADTGTPLDVALRGELEPHLGAPVLLEDREAAAILKADISSRPERLRHLADSRRGAIDFVLVTSVETRFANRAGGGRVWYEGSGTITVHNAWSGQTLDTFKETITANGVGHDRAAAEARKKVTEALAATVAASFGSVK